MSHDPIISPAHYTQGGMETIDILKAKLSPEQLEGFCLGNAIKYITRSAYKGHFLEDIKKARWYLDCLISQQTSYHKKENTSSVKE